MSVSTPFIHRPIATSLLGIAVMLGGALGYWWLPVSALVLAAFNVAMPAADSVTPATKLAGAEKHMEVSAGEWVAPRRNTWAPA